MKIGWSHSGVKLGWKLGWKIGLKNWVEKSGWKLGWKIGLKNWVEKLGWKIGLRNWVEKFGWKAGNEFGRWYGLAWTSIKRFFLTTLLLLIITLLDFCRGDIESIVTQWSDPSNAKMKWAVRLVTSWPYLQLGAISNHPTPHQTTTDEIMPYQVES